MEKPPAQRVAPPGVDAFQPMGGVGQGNPINKLREVSADARFQQWIAQQAGVQGPMNARRAIEATFRHLSVPSWSDLVQEPAASRFWTLLRAFQSAG